MPELLSHAYCTVASDPARGILRFTRTDLPFASLGDVGELHEMVARVLDWAGRDWYTLLVDMRRVPMNYHPEFEQAAARGRRILVRGFGRVAVLVQTAVGALQVKRHVREDNIPAEVFTDEAQAIQFLCKVEPEPAPVSSVGPVKDGPFNSLSRLVGRK